MSSTQMAQDRKIDIMNIKQIKTPFYQLQKKDIFVNVQERISAKVNGATVIIPHVCNNINVFGGGFTSGIVSTFPVVAENFYLLGSKAKLGHTQFVSAAKNKEYNYEIIFANMIAQNNIRSHKNPRPLNYEALVYAMNAVKLYILDYTKKNDNTNIEIHCPKFGSGLAGGDWKFIVELINDIWYPVNKNIFVYSL